MTTDERWTVALGVKNKGRMQSPHYSVSYRLAVPISHILAWISFLLKDSFLKFFILSLGNEDILFKGWLGWHISFSLQMVCYDPCTTKVKSVIVSCKNNESDAILITICYLKKKNCEICCIFLLLVLFKKSLCFTQVWNLLFFERDYGMFIVNRV